MSSISFSGSNEALQVGINNGLINYLPPGKSGTGQSPGPLTNYRFPPLEKPQSLLKNSWSKSVGTTSATIPLEDRTALKRKKGGPAPGTCEWVLHTKELIAWLGSGPTAGPESQLAHVLWFYGNPGTGKSIMAIYLTEELSKVFANADEKMLAFFFCDSGSDQRRTAISVIKGLLYQLAKQNEKLLNYLLPKYDERGPDLFTSFDALWEIFMAMVADENTGQKYCIIDALDECDRESQEVLLLQLEETFQSRDVSSNVRILITSRPYPEIRESLQIFPNRDLASFAQREKDISLFIEQKVNRLAGMKKYTDKVKSQVCEILQDKAAGTFLWIGLACDELKNIASNRVIRVLQNIPKGLNALYQTLLEAALKHDETTGGDTRRLLSCVAVSVRPLTMSELSEACQLHQEEEDAETRVQFTCDSIESCRLLIIIQDERVLLLHQSVKDDLVGDSSNHFIETSKAHASMAYRCVDILIEQFDSTNQPKSDFLDYATRAWTHHARIAESDFRVQLRQAEFFQLDSPCREWWFQNLNSTRTLSQKIPANFSIFHIAAKWGICALVDYAFDSGIQESDVEMNAYVAQVNCADWSGQAPLEYAVGSKDLNVVAALLGWGGKVTIQVVRRAAQNEQNGKSVLAFILDCCGQIPISNKVFTAAARNEGNGEAVMALLLDLCGDQIPISNKVVTAAAGNEGNGKAVMALLFNHYGDQITITNEVLEAAAGNRGDGKAVMALLLDRCGDQITITNEVLEAAAGNRGDGKAVMALLLDHYGDHITITENVVTTAAGNEGDGKAVIALLLDRYGDHITITHGIVDAAAGNWKNGNAVMALLLDHCSDQVTIRNDLISAIARQFDVEIITQLQDRCGDQITITNEVIKAAVEREENREVAKNLLLNHFKDPVTGVVKTPSLIGGFTVTPFIPPYHETGSSGRKKDDLSTETLTQ